MSGSLLCTIGKETTFTYTVCAKLHKSSYTEMSQYRNEWWVTILLHVRMWANMCDEYRWFKGESNTVSSIMKNKWDASEKP